MPLTREQEERRQKGLCVICGEVAERQGKKVRLDCRACFERRSGLDVDPSATKKDFGASQGSVYHEYARRLGYGARDVDGKVK